MLSFSERFRWCAPDKVLAPEPKATKVATRRRAVKAAGVSTARARENAMRVAKVRREAKARAAAIGRAPDHKGFAAREAALLAARPHLAEHAHCGLCPDSEVPRRRVKLPNGLVIHSSWYKVPTTDADAQLALRETRWLNEQARKAA